MTPRNLFRLFATAEVITWAGLIAALILRATNVTDAAVSIAGGVHGFVFLSYCAVTIMVWINQKWSAALGLSALALSVVPFATYPFELIAERRGHLAGPWRLAPGAETPKGFFEHMLAWILRRPFLAIGLVALAVVIVFVLLLWAGPPIPKS